MRLYSTLWNFFVCVVLCISILSCRKKPVDPGNDKKETVISISPDVLRLAKNQTATEKLVAKLNDGALVNVNWSSSNPAVATISSDGIVTGSAAGQAEIRATAISGNGTGTIKVFVYDLSDYKFRITLKDKGPVTHSFSRPQEFLSPRALEQRNRFSIPIDSADIPIASSYIREIEKTGAKIVAKSKWVKTVSVHCFDSVAYEKIKALPFVQNISLVWTGKKDTASYLKTLVKSTPATLQRSVTDAASYGIAWDNIAMNKGQVLHEAGFKGNGMDIAVIDNGFYNILFNSMLKDIKIKAAKSFVYESTNPFASGSHGLSVTSCMATNRPGIFIGTAPEASYWLFKTEDDNSEYPIEEDYWVAAVEYADSAGVFIANTSLGYDVFDAPISSSRYEDLDGKTTQAAKAAAVAAKKGMLLVISAGNATRYVGTPADSPDVLTVGSVDRNGKISYFSSYGTTVDGRMKPDVLGLGTSTAIITTAEQTGYGNGTSFAAPVLCGQVACLWQAYPKLTNLEIIAVVKQSANRWVAPELPYGYGLPDMEKAFQLAKTLSNSK